MTVAEQILKHVKELPEDIQSEVLDFVEYLESKTEKTEKERSEWLDLSLSQAMRGMESEPSQYSMEDISAERLSRIKSSLSN